MIKSDFILGAKLASMYVEEGIIQNSDIILARQGKISKHLLYMIKEDLLDMELNVEQLNKEELENGFNQKLITINDFICIDQNN